jgi:hypothetical protein
VLEFYDLRSVNRASCSNDDARDLCLGSAHFQSQPERIL